MCADSHRPFFHDEFPQPQLKVFEPRVPRTLKSQSMESYSWSSSSFIECLDSHVVRTR